MDATCRELLRAWRRDPTDAVAADACAAALHRARVGLPWALIPALSRWRQPLGLVARFAAQPPAEADGWPEAELLAAEARLGFRLPAALREWYRVVGRWTGAPRLHEWTTAPAALELVDGHLLLLRARGWEAQASVREADLARDDPRLFVAIDRRSEWGALGDPLSVGLGGALALEVAQDGPWAAEIRVGHFQDVDLRPEPPVPLRPRGTPAHDGRALVARGRRHARRPRPRRRSPARALGRGLGPGRAADPGPRLKRANHASGKMTPRASLFSGSSPRFVRRMASTPASP